MDKAELQKIAEATVTFWYEKEYDFDKCLAMLPTIIFALMLQRGWDKDKAELVMGIITKLVIGIVEAQTMAEKENVH